MNKPPAWNVREDYPIHLLKPYEHNPRKITKAQFEKLRDSINQDGYHQPIIANTDGTIIGGHSRCEALRRMGFSKVRVLMPDRALTPEEFDRVNVRDNIGFGEWDVDILSSRFDMDTLAEWGLDEKILGNFAPTESSETSVTEPKDAGVGKCKTCGQTIPLDSQTVIA